LIVTAKQDVRGSASGAIPGGDPSMIEDSLDLIGADPVNSELFSGDFANLEFFDLDPRHRVRLPVLCYEAAKRGAA
jgi:hypothetical protein